MRLSDLMKNKGMGKPAPPKNQPETKEDNVVSTDPVERELDQFVAPPPQQSTTPEPEPTPAAPAADKREQPAPAERKHYSSTPRAILDAAQQLDIAVPRGATEIIAEVMSALDAIFIRVADADDDKAGLWEASRHCARDLSSIIALGLDFSESLTRTVAESQRLLQHSVNTALLSMHLAKEVSGLKCTTEDLGAAALLHDIGMQALGLTLGYDESSPEFRRHVEAGVAVSKQIKAPELVSTVIEQHHEKIDGNGYPNHLKGSQVLLSSQVLALSEGFERTICQHAQQHAPEDENHMQTALKKYRTAYDPQLLKKFISLQGFYPNGTMVELTNRAICMVIKQNEGSPLRPVVQMVVDGAGNHPAHNALIDLRANQTLAVLRAVAHSKK